jgi:mono/diheme cytochrome c family protein
MNMRTIRISRALVAVFGVFAMGWSAFAAAASIADAAQLEKGRYLTLAGDCASCHTAQGGKPFAGGRVMSTPFGTIPTPNITPDKETGIGGWTSDEFYQVMHNGVGRDGHLFYPAFPFTSYTKITRADVNAIYAYLHSLAPIKQLNQAADLRFPYNERKLMTAWRALYFDEGEYVADHSRNAQWNRGAYLVKGLGHCNDCHTARNSLGATLGEPMLAGGLIPMQDWYAPDLSTQANGGLAGWTQKDIVDLLKTGNAAKGTAFGPMAEVVKQSTQHLSDEDLTSIAVYLQSLPARPVVKADDNPADSTIRVAKGNKIYTDHCATCHGTSGGGVAGVYPALDRNSSVMEPSGVNAIRVTLVGGFAPVTAGNPRPYSMPPFSQQLSDDEVADVVTYIRQAWTNKAPSVNADNVRTFRSTPAY